MVHMVFSGGSKLFWCFLCSACALYFYKGTFAFAADHKIRIQPQILVKIVEFPAHFGEDIRNQILKNDFLVSVQLALQDIILCAILQFVWQTVFKIGFLKLLNELVVVDIVSREPVSRRHQTQGRGQAGLANAGMPKGIPGFPAACPS